MGKNKMRMLRPNHKTKIREPKFGALDLMTGRERGEVKNFKG
jgi:hypothetical protein